MIMNPIGIIAGSGIREFLDNAERKKIKTDYGTVEADFGKLAGCDVVFLNRHGSKERFPSKLHPRESADHANRRFAGHRFQLLGNACSHDKRLPKANDVPKLQCSFEDTVCDFVANACSNFGTPNLHGKFACAPHKINFQANIAALKKCRVGRIIGISSVGIINMSMEKIIVVNDFFDHTKETRTFYDKPVHVDMSKPYCPELNGLILKSCRKLGVKASEGAYVCVSGPRLETPKEIEIFGKLGCDVVGMTSVPEAILARELEMCYSTIAIGTNYAAGLQEKLAADEIIAGVEKYVGGVKAILRDALPEIPEKRGCVCSRALSGAKL